MDSFIENLKRREIPSLYGLRGIAALTVVFGHYCYGAPVVGLFKAGYAVSLFFILSGLLITWLMLRERDKTGDISIPQFYARRSLRIFPVFYAVWIVCAITTHPFPEKWWTFFYMQDYGAAIGVNSAILGVAWSLGVEEKFYLLWPTIVKFLNPKRITVAVAVITAVDQIIREWMIWAGYSTYAHYGFETNWDCLLIGSLIALLAHQGFQFPKWLASPLVPLAAIVSLYTCNEIIVHYLLALALIWAITKQPWILNNRLVHYLGLISYSLYLCHIPAERLVWEPLLHDVHFSRWSLQILSKILVALVCASLLHFGIERPFLKLKDRFHKRVSVGVGDVMPSGAVTNFR